MASQQMEGASGGLSASNDNLATTGSNIALTALLRKGLILVFVTSSWRRLFVKIVHSNAEGHQNG